MCEHLAQDCYRKVAAIGKAVESRVCSNLVLAGHDIPELARYSLTSVAAVL